MIRSEGDGGTGQARRSRREAGNGLRPAPSRLSAAASRCWRNGAKWEKREPTRRKLPERWRCGEMVREMRRNGRQSSRWRRETARAGNGGALRAHGMGAGGGRDRRAGKGKDPFSVQRLVGTALCGGLPRTAAELAGKAHGLETDRRTGRKTDGVRGLPERSPPGTASLNSVPLACRVMGPCATGHAIAH